MTEGHSWGCGAEVLRFSDNLQFAICNLRFLNRKSAIGNRKLKSAKQ
jgi:hypothetical protein